MTSRDKIIVGNYMDSDVDELYKCYGRVSSDKQKHWAHCRALCYQHGGRDLRVISSNRYVFTAGFQFEKDGKKYLMYISKSEYQGRAILIE